MDIKFVGAAEGNFASGGIKPVAVVIHLMDGTLVGTDNWFNTTPEKRGGPASSAHYGIGKLGEVHQYVKETDRAYHAGRVSSPSTDVQNLINVHGLNPNTWSIGIEHEGKVDDDWSSEMVDASAQLVTDICKRYSIPIDRQHVVKHHEVFSPKPCPGPKCPIDDIVSKAAVL